MNLKIKKKRILSQKSKDKIRLKLIKYHSTKEKQTHVYNYICTVCNDNFIQEKKFRTDRIIKCSNCRKKRIVYDLDKIESLYDLSLRTTRKIIKRANIGCAICAWNEASVDIHHINGRKIQDADNHKNLVCLCPNHHRLTHNKKSSKELLLSKSLFFQFPNWKEFYNIR